MKFNHIFGNPPFQDSKNKRKTQHKIWIDFTNLAINDWLKEGGTLNWITPMSWGSPSNKILGLLKEHEVDKVYLDTKKYFPSIGSTFCHYHLKKKAKKNQTTFLHGNSSFSFKLDSSFLYIPNDVCTTSLSIHKKVMHSNHKKYKLNYDYVTCHNVIRHAVSLNKKKISKKCDQLKLCKNLNEAQKVCDSIQNLYERQAKIDITVSETKTKKHIYPILHTNNKTWFSSKKQEFFDKKKVIWSRSGYTKPVYNKGGLGCTDMGYFILVDTDSKGLDLERYLNSKIMKYIFKTAKWSGFGNELVFSSIPIIDTSKCKNDDDYYNSFGLTKAEIKYIESVLVPPKKPKNLKVSAETKSNKRVKEFGEVFTPKELVLEMLEMVSNSEWKNKESTFIDPACGNGNFLIEIFIKRLNSGISVEDSLETLYGIDIMTDNIKDCHDRILKYLSDNKIKHNKKKVKTILSKNIVLNNALENKMDKIFLT